MFVLGFVGCGLRGVNLAKWITLGEPRKSRGIRSWGVPVVEGECEAGERGWAERKGAPQPRWRKSRGYASLKKDVNSGFERAMV